MRPAAVAGTFYPSDKKRLDSLLKELFEKANEVRVDGVLRGLIVPHAGYVFSGLVAATAYKVLREHREVKEIILLGPSHYVPVKGTFSPFDEVWLFPFGPYRVYRLEGFPPSKEVHEREHSLEVQIPFLWKIGFSGKVYPLAIAIDSPERLADELMNHIKEGTLILVSSDLSHYYPYEVAKALDSFANECIPALDLECVKRKVEACGKLGILTLMEIASKKGWKGKFLAYMNSGDVYEKSSVVGYGSYAFFEG